MSYVSTTAREFVLKTTLPYMLQKTIHPAGSKMCKINNNKDIRKTSKTSRVFITHFEHTSHLNFTVIDFEQINTSW